MSTLTPAPVASIGSPISEVDSPALLLDLAAFERNLDRLQTQVKRAGMTLRPHAKAHKCPAIALAQIARGAVGVCCQKVSEAIPFIQAGISNIHISNEIATPGKANWLASLAHHAQLSICVDSLQQITALAAAVAQAGSRLTVLLEIDIGHGRCGISNPQQALQLVQSIADSPGLSFGGLQAYHGSVQHVRSADQRQSIIDQANTRTQHMRLLLEHAGWPCPTVTGGGTGSAEFDLRCGIYTELQAGSYAFMDVDYSLNEATHSVDSLHFEHSLLLASRVMSCVTSTHVVLDAGLKSMSLESGLPKVWDPTTQDISSRWVCVDVSDEHTIVQALPGADAQPLPRWGEQVLLVPSHVDPTFNLHDTLIAHRNGKVEALWPISARGYSR